MINETVNRIPVLVLDKAGRSSLKYCLDGVDCPGRMAIEATVRNFPYPVFLFLGGLMLLIVIILKREDGKCIKA